MTSLVGSNKNHSLLLSLQPLQFSLRLLLKGFLPQLQEGSLVSGPHLLLTDILLHHASYKVVERLLASEWGGLTAL